MKAILLLCCLCYASIGLSQPATNQIEPEDQEKIIREIQQSHIADNIPEKEVFTEFLIRDVRSYMGKLQTNDFKLDYEFLRDGPTQSGVAYPKFYIWVKCSVTNELSFEGVMRLAAIDKKRFEVTTFVKKSEIIANPKVIEGEFPQLLLPKIREKAGLKG